MMAPLRRAWLFHHSTGVRKDQECVYIIYYKIKAVFYSEICLYDMHWSSHQHANYIQLLYSKKNSVEHQLRMLMNDGIFLNTVVGMLMMR